MKYSKHIGYGFLLGTSMMLAAGLSVKADENEETPIPVEDQVIIDDSVTEEIPAGQEMKSDTETVQVYTKTVSINPVHGVLTGINTHFTRMMNMLLSSIISIVYLFRKKREIKKRPENVSSVLIASHLSSVNSDDSIVDIIRLVAD